MNYIDRIAVRIYRMAEKTEDSPFPAEFPLYRMYAVLALAKGRRTTAEDVHHCWCAWQSGINPLHHSLIPFAKLSPDVQALDDAYVEAIHEVSEA